ncbi:hypothetical protein [Methylobacterium sp. NFXW15]|uniref:hypothetical protein n=1 Tax=Methylobacterium sp. NFXW15 TaxID=2819512 RepID=UPI003CF00FF7
MTITTSGPLVQAHEPSQGVSDDLEKDLDKGPENVVSAPNNPAGFSGPVSPPGDQPVLEILIPDQELGLFQPDRPSRGRARAHLGSYKPQHADAPEPANDDTLAEAPSKPKRAWSLRKRESEDLRRRTKTLAITGAVYEQGRQAFGSAEAKGHDLDCLVTIRPAAVDTMSPEEREDLFKKMVHAMRTAFAANENLPEPAYLWSRESKRVGTARKPEGVGEHLHVVVASGGRLDLVEKYFRKHLSGHEVDVRPVDAVTRRLRNGQIGDAGTYLMKAVEPAYWRKFPQTPHRASGPIFGQRVGWSKNLLNEQPVGRKPRPRRAG